MRERFKGVSLRGKINILLLIQAVVILSLVSSVFSNVVENILRKNVVSHSAQVLTSLKGEIDAYTKSVFSTTQDFFYNNYAYKDDESEIRMRVIETELTRMAKGDRSIMGVWFYDVDIEKQYVPVNHRIASENKIILDEIRNLMLTSQKTELWYIVGSENSTSGIYYSRRMPDMSETMKNGVLIVQIDAAYFGEICEKYTVEPVKLMLISGNENFIYNKTEENLKVYEAVSEILPKFSRKIFNDNKNKMLIFSDTCIEGQFKIVMYSHFSDIYAEVYRIRFWAVIMGFILLTVLLLCNAYLKSELIKPLLSLVKLMGKNNIDGIGDYAQDIPENELKVLYLEYNHMNERIRQLIDQNYRTKLITNDMQIKALQAQMNPHFLFNTLQSIYWLTQTGEKKEAGKAVNSLASMIGAALHLKKLISLQEEINFVGNYMKIVHTRYENTVLYSENIEEDTLKAMIPGLLIQPLIENCVEHGKGEGRELEISLSAKLHGDNLIICVRDNGGGIDKELIDTLNERFKLSNDEWFTEYKEHKSIALENTNRRIKLIFGEKYGLFVESEPGKYTGITATLPYRILDEEKMDV